MLAGLDQAVRAAAPTESEGFFELLTALRYSLRWVLRTVLLDRADIDSPTIQGQVAVAALATTRFAFSNASIAFSPASPPIGAGSDPDNRTASTRTSTPPTVIVTNSAISHHLLGCLRALLAECALKMATRRTVYIHPGYRSNVGGSA